MEKVDQTPVSAEHSLDNGNYYSDSFNQYLDEIGRIALLSGAEQFETATLVQAGDQAAIEKMMTANLRLVVSVAKAWQHNGLEIADLVQEGNIGLRDAVRLFNPQKGFKFSTYAAWWIRQAVTRAIETQSHLIHIPGHQQQQIRALDKFRTDYARQFRQQPTVSEIASYLDETVERTEELIRWQLRMFPRSLDKPLTSDNGDQDHDYYQLLADKNQASVEETVTNQFFTEELMSCLDQQQKTIIIMSFGLYNQPACSLPEISEQIGLSKSRVSRLRQVALESMRCYHQSRQTQLATVEATEVR